MLMGIQYILHKHSKSMGSGKSKACKCKNVKGWELESKTCNLQESKGMGLECSNAMETQINFRRGSDRWCYRTSTLMETSTHRGQRLCMSMEVSTHEGSMMKQPCLSHHGHRPRRTCLTRLDLHQVGDLLALTNFLVQLHIMSEAPK